MPKKVSRTKNSIYNFITSIGAQLISIVMNFACRTVFINTLGKSYLGISSLFSNILSMLSLAELGVGTAIIYKLYQPLAENDHPRIRILMNFYKKVYRIIALVVAGVGICLIPFLPSLISDYDKLETLGLNATFIFLLYLFKSVSSYMFFAYRSSLIKADQKEYILTTTSYIIIIAQNILQMISLVVLEDFVVYVLIMILSVIVENIIYAVIVQKNYPYVSERTTEKLSKEETKGIFKDCYALLLYRINGVVLKSTDNIVLSAFMGLDTVALYSNYYVFYTTINTLFTKIYGAVAHSIGNLHTTHDSRHEYQIFKSMELLTAILGGTACAGIFVVADEFVDVWIGEDWTIGGGFAFAMGFELFTLSMRVMLSKYRNAMGLFQQAKYRPVLGAIVNIVVSIVLVNYLGVTGVILGTIVADWSTFMVFDPRIIHKYGFKGAYSVSKYYLRIFKYIVILAVMEFLDYQLCHHFITGYGWLSVVVHILIVAATVPLAYVAVCWRTSECQYFVRRYGSKIMKIIKK